MWNDRELKPEIKLIILSNQKSCFTLITFNAVILITIYFPKTITFSYVCPFIVIRLDAQTPKLNFDDDIVELENCVLRVVGSFGTTTSSRFLRLPSLNEDSVAPDLCLDGLSSVL